MANAANAIQKFNDTKLAGKLKDAGLTVEWYEAQKVKQNGLCDRCLKTETRKDPTGGKKNLMFSPERKSLICSNCATNKTRKTTQERLKVEAAQSAADVKAQEPKTAHEYWSRNRLALTNEERIQLEGRELDVMLLADALIEFLQATEYSQQDLLDTIEEVEMEVEEFGTIPIELTLIPNFWKDSELMAGVARKSKAAETFSTLGYVTAIPDHRYHAFWKKFMQPKAEPKPMYNPISGKSVTPSTPEPHQEWVQLSCTTCKKSEGTVTVKKEIADGYQRINKAFRCGNCIAQEQAFRGKQFGLAAPQPENKSPIDGWGRTTIFTSKGPVSF